MATNVVNQVAYLRTSREFPEDIRQLTRELSKSYIDTSNAVNERTIGIFPVNRSAISGESWFITGNQKQQGLRQVYAFTTTADINIGFKFASLSQFTKLSGVYTDGTNWYGLIPGTNVAVAGQILFYLAPNGASAVSDVIKFKVDAGAPALSRGTIVLEWISDK